jgi:hypothetical protein
LVQTPSHRESPVVHADAGTQTPLVQTCVSVHACPQVPQLSRSLESATHDVPHAVSPLGQFERQPPDEHTRPVPHTVPHAPQLLPSVSPFTSQPVQGLPSQLRNGAVQESVHVDDDHTLHPGVEFGPLGQLPLQLVQVETSQPLAGSPSQLPLPDPVNAGQ